jgi:hypothetical protein
MAKSFSLTKILHWIKFWISAEMVAMNKTLTHKEYSRSSKRLLGKYIYFWKALIEINSTVYIIAAPIEVKGQNEVPKFSKDEVKLRILDAPSDSTHSTYISLHSARRAEFIDTPLDSVTWPLNFDSVNIYLYSYKSDQALGLP